MITWHCPTEGSSTSAEAAVGHRVARQLSIGQPGRWTHSFRAPSGGLAEDYWTPSSGWANQALPGGAVWAEARNGETVLFRLVGDLGGQLGRCTSASYRSCPRSVPIRTDLRACRRGRLDPHPGRPALIRSVALVYGTAVLAQLQPRCNSKVLERASLDYREL